MIPLLNFCRLIVSELREFKFHYSPTLLDYPKNKKSMMVPGKALSIEVGSSKPSVGLVSNLNDQILLSNKISLMCYWNIKGNKMFLYRVLRMHTMISPSHIGYGISLKSIIHFLHRDQMRMSMYQLSVLHIIMLKKVRPPRVSTVIDVVRGDP
ncbi:hypothetical protein H5410_061105, partial [Solanum commersonii]